VRDGTVETKAGNAGGVDNTSVVEVDFVRSDYEDRYARI
jgi:hypothetical protein